jgi:hypothetical protein
MMNISGRKSREKAAARHQTRRVSDWGIPKVGLITHSKDKVDLPFDHPLIGKLQPLRLAINNRTVNCSKDSTGLLRVKRATNTTGKTHFVADISPSREQVRPHQCHRPGHAEGAEQVWTSSPQFFDIDKKAWSPFGSAAFDDGFVALPERQTVCASRR